ncbi:probable G-protein coupled receptor 82 isoform X1 [Coregonus clupeaformis]|uniref:probable G-protein coupled receptor 82 isoform X1 n=1 Tax=Coregonus clupeaformis TaxID=59861 RepID=UPI001E1C7FAB|nr:probable G-protein coupled receptor 82 isoform X1 [Coregonus clupeaformis]XP_041699917.2 probable G-protein coupled receptor 82 isoform X1 [Coregonus clupeaformis]
MENTSQPFPPVSNTSYLNASSISPLCPSFTTRFVLPSLYTLLFLTGLPGNALSLWVFLRRIPTQTSTHVYLSHLGLSNLCLSLTTPFLAAYYSQGPAWLVWSPLCQLVLHGVTPIQQINIYISIFILTWVALSRFATLIQHTHASRPSTCTTLLPLAFFTRLRRVRFAKAVCAGVWIMVVVAIVPVTVYYSVRETKVGGGGENGGRGGRGEEKGGRVCYSVAMEMGGSLSRGAMVVAIVIFFMCFLLVLTSYMAVARHIWRSRRSAAVNGSQKLLGRVFRNIVVIQVVLIVCMLPYHIFKSIFVSIVQHQADPATTTTRGPCHPLSAIVEVKNLLLCLTVLRCSADPVMYFLLDKTFHRHVMLLLRLHPQKPSSQSSSGATTRANPNGVRLEETVCHKGEGPWKESFSVNWSQGSAL